MGALKMLIASKKVAAIILISTCGNNESWVLNLNLICKTLWAVAGNGLLKN